MTAVNAERLREYSGLVTNTDIWDSFDLRSDDVIVCTPPKSGTTWTLNIVMMLFHGRVVPDAGNRYAAPWLDCAFRDRAAIADSLNRMDQRRCIKTHTPMDGINYAREPTYIVVYRHPIDVHFSFRTHVGNMKHDFLDYMFPDNEAEGFRRFVEAPLTDSGTDDLTVASIAEHYQQARKRLGNGNIHFVHYSDLTRDLPGQVARLAEILEIPIAPDTLQEIAKANTFAAMRSEAEQNERRFHEESPFHDQANFFASGTSNKWENRLGQQDLNAYDTRIASLLPPADLAWLQWGDRGTP